MFWIVHCGFEERGDLVDADALLRADSGKQLP
jgi:hypothetical protein